MKQFLKVIGTIAAILLVIIIVAFGLLVGICGLKL